MDNLDQQLPEQPTSFFCYIRRLMAKNIGNVPNDVGRQLDMTCSEAGCTTEQSRKCIKLIMLESNSMKKAGTDTREGFYKTDWSKFK